MAETGSDMTASGVYQNFAIDRVVYGRPAAEVLVAEATRLGARRVFLLVSRTLDRVEETSDMVHKTVVSPVRQFSGLIQGVTAGVEFLLGGRGRKNGRNRDARRPVPQDEMFI